jgi:hypothetical protein
MATGENLYLISGEQGWSVSGGPFPLEILLFDDAEHQLISKWQYQGMEDVQSVDVFPDENYVLISTGISTISEIIVCRAKTVSNPLHIVFANAAHKYNLVSSKSDGFLICVNFGYDKDTKLPLNSFYRISDGEELLSKSLSQYNDIRVSNGPSMSRAGVLTLNKAGDLFRVRISNNLLETAPMPADLLKSDTARGWKLIANTEEYYAISVLAFDEKAKYSEILLYDKRDSIWNSFLIEGGETRLRLINNILVGNIANANPETDHSKFMRFPSDVTYDIIILDPIMKTQSVIYFDNYSEVLWIFDKRVIYRIENNLYEAFLDNGKFVDNKVILSDPRIKHIHWAFPEKEN